MAASRPRGEAVALVNMPRTTRSPFNQLLVRFLIAAGLLLLSTLIVYFDGDAYADNVNGDGIDFIDALYYSTVTMTTTGYGDITPIAPHSRFLGAVVITPLRILFLVVLVGTTIEVLANEGNRAIRDLRWRKRMRNHIVVIGYGTKGRSAVNTLRRQGESVDKIVVIDSKESSVADANFDGLSAFLGDATRRDLLRRAEVPKAREIVVCLDRDDAAILTTLTVRQLNPTANVVVAVREYQNAQLVKQSGATSVVTSSETVGRLLGLTAIGPDLGAIIQDMLTGGEGLEVHQRQATPSEVGQSPTSVTTERVIGVVRGGTLRRFYDSTVARIETGDDLIVVRRAAPADPEVIHQMDDEA